MGPAVDTAGNLMIYQEQTIIIAKGFNGASG